MNCAWQRFCRPEHSDNQQSFHSGCLRRLRRPELRGRNLDRHGPHSCKPDWNKGDNQKNAAVGYDEMAWLFMQMLNPKNASMAGDIPYAIWAVFDPQGLLSISGAHRAKALGWLAQAEKQTYSGREFSNIVFFRRRTRTIRSCSAASACGLLLRNLSLTLRLPSRNLFLCSRQG